MNILVLVSVGVRASVTVAATLVAILYADFWWRYTKLWFHGRPADPRLKNAAAYFYAGLAFVVFFGKRVIATLLWNEPIFFDRGTWETVGTCIGLGLSVLFLYMSASAKLQYIGKERLSFLSGIGICAAGVAFAVFYAIHHVLSARLYQ